MDIIAYLICFTVAMINLFGRGDPNPLALCGALIGLGLSAIAGEINSWVIYKKNSKDGDQR